jgi:hypothetical protein
VKPPRNSMSELSLATLCRNVGSRIGYSNK